MPIAEYLTCPHCGVEFIGTASQRKHFKYDQRKAYCSALCRVAANPLRTEVPERGPCPTCGEMFRSRRSAKIFCSMKCYTASPAFKTMVRNNWAAAIRNGHHSNQTMTAAGVKTYEEFVRLNTLPCDECGKPYYAPPAKRRKFCSTLCRRRWFAKRFDRWVANPEEIALPQNFDEFLSQNELPCLVKGCDWVGRSLSNHMNQRHGVPAAEFKRAAGFNLKSGIISADLQEILSARENVGVGLSNYPRPEPMLMPPRTRHYHSLEAKEHAAKARALLLAAEPGPMRECHACGKEFQQSTPFGKAMYCTPECRDRFYHRQRAAIKTPMTCAVCSKPFVGSLDQAKRNGRGLPVVCSNHCRQTLNARKAKRSPASDTPACGQSPPIETAPRSR